MNRFVIADSTLCIGCHTCEAACSETHRQHGLQSMPRLKVMLNEKESAPQLCHHCEDAPCATVCPVNAINRVDGAVQLNESLCVSCKLCGIACPFGAIEFSGSRPLHIPANVAAEGAIRLEVNFFTYLTTFTGVFTFTFFRFFTRRFA
ncbi:4Fe-4S binding protein, partial [Salmonella enterica subsp. enterica serovar Kentucky]|nr:4Fe-4S binding protein [Salmonella enterica subsp. enterica serovar Kentucky]